MSAPVTGSTFGSPTFYSRFERHAHGAGLKGHSTHYCAGCGHGLAHKFLAESIDELGIQDRVVAVSPVGCAVFMFYYLDVGNTQAPHGRAPAVAIGHKTANPDSIVISYQGDGDLASIGLAEIVSTAQLGIPISVIFVNNAIYGMTGGQLAPTTLMGQRSSTSPTGRTPLMGSPMRMAELIAGLDGPVYVERVALYDSKQRVKAKKAISKALECQVKGIGFSFVEVLAECPTHLGLDPEQAEKWVEEQMVPVYPLGLKKDITADGPHFPQIPRPGFDPDHLLHVIDASAEPPPRFARSFPTHLAPTDVSLKLAGAGGDGAQTIALFLTKSAIAEGYDSTYIPSYGPESRGGTSYADVHVASEEVLSPSAPDPHVLLAFNAPSLVKFGPMVRPGGHILYDSTVVHDVPAFAPGVRVHGVPFTAIARDLGKVMVKNVVALGALQAATQLFPPETLLHTLRVALKDKAALLPMNEEAFRRGARSVLEAER